MITGLNTHKPRTRQMQGGVLALMMFAAPLAAQDTNAVRYERAMSRALTLAQSNAHTRAQLWLRRAVQSAPNSTSRHKAINAFKHVRRANPWSTDVSFSIAPTTNANNGSRRDAVRLFDLPIEWQLVGASKALSGIQIEGAIATRYRLRETGRSRHELFFSAQNRTYVLSKDALAIAQSAKGRDFAYSLVSVGYGLKAFVGPGAAFPLQAEIALGRSWYGYEPQTDFARLGVTQGYAPNRSTQFFVSGSLEHQASLSAGQDALIAGLSTGVSVKLANSDTLHLSISGKRSQSESSHLDYHQVEMSVRYVVAKPIAGISASLGLSVSKKSHERSQYSRFGREDSTLVASVTGKFTQIEYLGFVPSVTITATRTHSTIGLFDRQGLGVQFGLHSAF